MEKQRFAVRQPVLFSILLVILYFVVNAFGVAAAQIAKLPPTTFAIHIQIVLAIVLVILVSAMRWWGEIGFGRTQSWHSLLIYVPGLILFFGNLTFGIKAFSLSTLLIYLLLAAFSGFTEEVTFRGLMLRAFLPRGKWTAVLASSAIFGAAHIMNVLAGSDPVYALIQVVYALAIGFCFGAMVLRGKMLWPVIVLHGLGNLAAFLNSGGSGGDQVTPYLIGVTLLYIIVFGGYGWFLMQKYPASQPVPEAI